MHASTTVLALPPRESCSLGTRKRGRSDNRQATLVEVTSLMQQCSMHDQTCDGFNMHAPAGKPEAGRSALNHGMECACAAGPALPLTRC